MSFASSILNLGAGFLAAKHEGKSYKQRMIRGANLDRAEVVPMEAAKRKRPKHRNDPCPCGSKIPIGRAKKTKAKKYSECCGRRN
jgi:hypothetical protein